MKRIVCMVLLTGMLMMLTACGGNATVAKEPAMTATAIPTETAAAPINELIQRQILENNQSLWEFTDPYDSPWFYTYTDLDHNGRLEVIAATTQGTGIFTYAHYWEVLPDGSGVRNCYHESVEIEGPDDWPEIVLDSLPCYYDRAANRYYYPCEGVTRSGVAYQYYAWYALCLENGEAEWEFLASKEVSYDEQGKEHVSCLDAAGNAVSSQDYDSAVERRFAGLEKSELALDWTQVDIPWEDGYEESADLYAGDYETAYSSVIGKYKAAYESGNKANMEYAWTNGISEMTAYSDGVGYALADLDENGVPELIIAGMGTDDFSDQMVYDLYTLVNGIPLNLATSKARERYYVLTDNSVYSEGSGGAAYTYLTRMRVKGSELEDIEVVFTGIDGEGTDSSSIVYYRQQGHSEILPSENSVRIREEEFFTRMEQLESSIYVPPLTKIY